jgi:hypothetical protein
MEDSSRLVMYAKKISEEHRGQSELVNHYRGLLDLVGRTTAERRDWAFSIASKLLVEEDEISRDLTRAMLAGWTDMEIEPAAVSEILEWMENQPWLPRHVEQASRIVERALAKNSKNFEEKDLDRAENLTEDLWSVVPLFEPSEGSRDWLHRAVDHSQGTLGLIVLHLASEWKTRRVECQDKLPVSLRRLIAQMMQAGPGRPLARVIVASQLNFFFAVDEALATAEILPWFDWKEKGRDSLQAWNGYLQWGRIYPSLFSKLRPFLDHIFERLQDLGEQRKRLGEFLAHLSMFPDSEPVEEGWLTKYFASASDEDRARWTAGLAREAESLGTEAARRTWQTWLQGWVADRLRVGYPEPAPAEISGFYGLALALPPEEVGNALEILRDRPTQPESFHGLLQRLEKRTAELKPDDLLLALVRLLEHAPTHLHFSDQGITAISEKIQASGRDDLKQRLKASLVRLQRPDLADRLLNLSEPERGD